MNERTLNLIKIVVSHLIPVPALIAVSFFVTRGNLIILTIAQTILIITFLSGYWEFTGLRFKRIYGLVSELLIIAAGIESILRGKSSFPDTWWFLILLVFQTYLWYILAKMVMVIFKKDHEVLEIEFPFRNGRFMVTDGGDSYVSRLMNYHYHSKIHKKKGTNKSMLYATDLVKLPSGRHSVMPRQNEDYPVFGEPIYAPMGGTVVKVINDIDDNIPFSGGYHYNTGNTVVIHKNNLFFLLGHMKKGSITVNEGQEIKHGDLIGEAGNSGMSERPHLHMQLIRSEWENYWKGIGICIRFGKRNLYKNRIVSL
jgi:biotin carboxyl carrier protein